MNSVIGIAGLGLIGGSLAKAIKAKTSLQVFGFDIREEVLAAAIGEKVIDGELTDIRLAECDIIVLALFPGEAVSYCTNNMTYMRSGAIVVDCAGVKTRICEELTKASDDYGILFVGGHPMAGVERSGYESSFAELFDGATMILCKTEETDSSALEDLSALFSAVGFGRINITTAREHDEVIAYTSQLAHLISSAYIKSETAEKRHGFSAGSFKDLSRVAKLDEEMWAELFFENRENLLEETNAFLARVQKYRDSLKHGDVPAMKELLRTGTEKKKQDEEKEQEWLKK